MKRLRWETDRRFYAVRVYQDLFNDWVVERAWGGKKSNLGNRSQEVLFTYSDAEQVIEKIKKERLAHKYDLVESIFLQ